MAAALFHLLILTNDIRNLIIIIELHMHMLLIGHE